MTTLAHILIIEDEPHLAELMQAYLQRENLQVTCLDNGSKVIPWLQNNKVDVILMDLMLPGEDGISLTRKIRQFSQTPIIITTAKVSEIDRLLGLQIGADDYVCKPYSPRELVARVKVQLRRLITDNVGYINGLQLDANQLKVHLNDQSITLTVVEFNLLQALYQHQAQVLNRDQLMNRAYQDHRIISDRTIDSHIKKIRKKLKTLTQHEYIRSVYGLGYQFIDIPEEHK